MIYIIVGFWGNKYIWIFIHLQKKYNCHTLLHPSLFGSYGELDRLQTRTLRLRQFSENIKGKNDCQSIEMFDFSTDIVHFVHSQILVQMLHRPDYCPQQPVCEYLWICLNNLRFFWFRNFCVFKVNSSCIYIVFKGKIFRNQRRKNNCVVNSQNT